jgi:hypothetical protein
MTRNNRNFIQQNFAEKLRNARPYGYLVRSSGESYVYKDQKYQHQMGWRPEPPKAPVDAFLTLESYGGTHDAQAAHSFRTSALAYDRAREVRRYFGAWAAPTYHLIPFWRQPNGDRRLGEPVEIRL